MPTHSQASETGEHPHSTGDTEDPEELRKLYLTTAPALGAGKREESMSEPSGSYPEILHQLRRIVARGEEAEKLLRLGDETLPKETLD